MEPYYYRTATRNSLSEDRTDIMAGFRELLKRGEQVQVKLVNYYKGLPISYPATVVEAVGEVLELDVHPQQAVALEMSRRTCIKCSHFQHALLAEVKDVDVRRQIASLYDLSYVDIMAEQRISLRLELEPPCGAEILADSGPIPGKVLDISLGGFSIRAERSLQLEKGTAVKLKVMVPNLLQNSETQLEVQSTVVDTVAEDSGELCRFSIASDPHVEAIISRFIFQRQVDLIRELKEQS